MRGISVKCCTKTYQWARRHSIYRVDLTAILRILHNQRTMTISWISTCRYDVKIRGATSTYICRMSHARWYLHPPYFVWSDWAHHTVAIVCEWCDLISSVWILGLYNAISSLKYHSDSSQSLVDASPMSESSVGQRMPPDWKRSALRHGRQNL